MDFQREIEKGISAVKILEKALDLMEKEMKHPEESLTIALYEYAETVNSDVMERLNRNAEVNFWIRWNPMMSGLNLLRITYLLKQ